MKKRLTKKGGLNFADNNLSLADEWGYSHIYNRLAELEDKIEQGTLIELPCKIGDTVYWVWDDYNDITKEQILSIEEWKVDRIQINENDWSVRGVDKPLENGDIPFFWCHSSRYKIYWFLTREEAEKRLKELKNG